jgi:pilus assembly protein CpaB
MKQKNMILLALAIGCGLVAAFLTAKLGASNRGEMIPVLVAAKNLDQGMKLEKPEELFVRRPFPKESVPPEFIDDIATLKGKNLQRTVRAGSHLTQADITPRNTIDLPQEESTGVQYKAMALRVSPETIVGGLVLPGSRVDVVNVEKLTNGKTQATMILQNVLVVGVDIKTVRNDDEGFIKNPQTVTMAVKQQEGLILALAQERGKMFLMLRDPSDKKVNKNLKSIVDYVNKSQDDNAGESGSSAIEVTKIPVAKQSIPAGTKIDNPADLFDEVEWPSAYVPDNCLTKLDELRGRTVTKDLMPKFPVAKEAFDGEAPKAIAKAPKDGSRHTITFQVGGGSPYYAHFRDGKLEDGFAAPASGPTQPSTEIKPRDKASDKPDQGQ